jgi:hypothetical protein
MINFIVGIVVLGLMLCAAASTVLSIYFFHRMLQQSKPDKKGLVRWFGPLLLASPDYWTETGNEARIRFLFWSMISFVCALALLILTAIVPPP